MIDQLRLRLLDRSRPMRIHLIGVAGAGMSGLARMLLEMGHLVSGCDRVSSDDTENLQSCGLRFFCPHTAAAVADAEVVIYSSAIRPDNVALLAAREKGIPCVRRAECLAAILNGKRGVVVAGTHGKTTTSSMTTHLLREGRLRPCHYVGAEIPVLGANAHWTEDSEYLVAEGDESDGTLVNYLPEHSIILNIEAEHLDFYRDLGEIKAVFDRLCRQTRGRIFYCAADPGACDVCSRYSNAVSYGWDHADYTAADVSEMRGRTLFTIRRQGCELGRVELGIPGRHNVLNALAAAAAALEMGCDFPSIMRGLSSFAGARRRFETKYLSPAYRIVDDYGHHPTEIAATLQTARSFRPRRLVVLFQPHRYTRTQMLQDDFGRVLQSVDALYVTDVYPASELPIEGVSGRTVVDAVHRYGPVETTYLPQLSRAHHSVGNALQPGDLLLTLGAGNVHEVGTRIMRDLSVLEDITRNVSSSITARLYEPMSRHTTMHVGGPAQFWLEPSEFEIMRQAVNFFKDRNFPVRIVGGGSNMIVRAGGIRGAVFHPTGGEFDELRVEGNRVIAGAAVRLRKVAAAAARAELTGLEWMDGIPGQVGGSLRMNAGAMGADMWRCFESALCLDEDGEIRTHFREDMEEATYRSIAEFRTNFVLQATFRGTPGKAAAIREATEAYRRRRRRTQPLEPSAGCTFINPPGIAVGRLIDELGLKGFVHGGAMISPVHANFIVNTGTATPEQITELIDIIRRRVQEERGVTLRTEVQVIGEREPLF
ncbi:MAG: UDP-N-acetylmuramate--L-alanine ligase [Akkermansiaceae bacterium]|nr:UDP-N-acetylmuramate--L-alanine ligase [Akkermansiaceae bacterium]